MTTPSPLCRIRSQVGRGLCLPEELMGLLMAMTLAAACSSLAVITDGSQVSARIGKLVEVRGTAQNAKLSAAVVAGNLVVYCLGVDGWPSTVVGKRLASQRITSLTVTMPMGRRSSSTRGMVR